MINEDFFFCNPNGNGETIFDFEEHCASDTSAGFKCFMDASYLADKVQNEVCDVYGPALGLHGMTVHIVERRDTCDYGLELSLGIPQCLPSSCASIEAFMEEFKTYEAMPGFFNALDENYETCASVNYWTESALEPQSQYHHMSYVDTSPFDWNITITDFMSIDKPTTDQGIYNLRRSYLLDDRS
jgi:hypothetical protein